MTHATGTTPAGGVGGTRICSLCDAGDASGEELGAALEQCLVVLASGQVLEVLAQHPDAPSDIRRWCQAAGHEWVDTVSDGTTQRVWIRKRREPNA